MKITSNEIKQSEKPIDWTIPNQLLISNVGRIVKTTGRCINENVFEGVTIFASPKSFIDLPYSSTWMKKTFKLLEGTIILKNN